MYSCAPGYLSKGVGNLLPPKILHMDIYRNFIHKCLHLEATKVSLRA